MLSVSNVSFNRWRASSILESSVVDVETGLICQIRALVLYLRKMFNLFSTSTPALDISEAFVYRNRCMYFVERPVAS